MGGVEISNSQKKDFFVKKKKGGGGGLDRRTDSFLDIHSLWRDRFLSYITMTKKKTVDIKLFTTT